MKLAPPSVHTLEKIPDTFSALGAIALRFAGRGRRDSWDCRGSSPHYSWTLLLQSPIRYYDEPSVGGLAPRTLNVLHEYASSPQDSTRRSSDAAQRFRNEPSW